MNLKPVRVARPAHISEALQPSVSADTVSGGEHTRRHASHVSGFDTGRDRQRRLLNLAVATIALTMLSPLMIALALSVRLTSRGPSLYSQPRVGLDRRSTSTSWTRPERRGENQGGRLFTIYKLRTMVAHGVPDQIWAQADDVRITRIGAILRRFRLDELPQLFNVIRGDMNVVGPRPEQPQIAQRLMNDVPEYRHRQRVLPGITGWAQVNHRYDQSLDDVRRKVALDLEYMHRRSTSEDLRIMVLTVPVMIRAKGAH